jgi:uncharacterized protein
MKTLFYFCLLLIIQLLPAEELKPNLTVQVPMRDGTKLPTDLYLPSPDAAKLPCILLRSPSGRQQPYWQEVIQLAKDGYVVAIQETRNILDAEGKTMPFLTDGWGKLQDGYDTVEWLAHSPYTNGKIGTWGASALGITQLLLAPSQPPHLLCQYLIVAPGSLYHHAIFQGGKLLKNQTEGWLQCCARDPTILNDVSQRSTYDDFWRQFNTLEVSHRVQVPGLHVAGWYDTFLQGSLAVFMSRQSKGEAGAHGQQKLVIGPWTHQWPFSQYFGDFEVPSVGKQPPVDVSPKRWFDYYLKGMANDVTDLPAVTYYVMGPFDGTSLNGNVWRTSSIWPIPAVQTIFYLTSDLRLKQTPVEEGKLSYSHDPHNPIPTQGGRNLFLESGPKDQRPIEKREDILVFTSDALPHEVEVTGPLSATVFVTFDQKEADLVGRLCDVYPDGRSILISEGVCRVNGTGDQPMQVEIDLWSTSLVFAKGHAIRFSVSSSNYPRYEKSLTVEPATEPADKRKMAKNTIYVGKNYPSRLILPIVSR